MKTYGLFIILISSFITAAPGCRDNSYHADRCKGCYDYKNYHYVECYCPCDRYPHFLERGRCRKCWHYRVPTPLYPRKKPSVKKNKSK